ncbi:TPD1 protein homolog 1-like [Wolffia australiana]
MATSLARLLSLVLAALSFTPCFFVGVASHNQEAVETALDPDRSGDGSCSKDYIVVYQAQTAPQPNGIPTYSVQILNTCLDRGCSSPGGGGISAVHLHCGWFSTVRLINPKIFRRLGFDDCLVNGGLPVPAGGAVYFQYTNTYPYPLSVSSVSC